VKIVITGAAGAIGRLMIDELGPTHELRLLDRYRVPDRRSLRADLSVARPMRLRRLWQALRIPRWEEAFSGADVVLHLAGNAKPDATFKSVLRHNVRATWNVLDAAARARVPRVVLASSARGALGLEREALPRWAANVGHIGAGAAPRPLSPYGLSKAYGELAGRMFVDSGRLPSVVAVRIGALGERRPATGPAMHRWVHPADLRTVLRRCSEASFEGFHVVYAVSTGQDGVFDLSHTQELLSWNGPKS
jgi:nucleoside-diphosphate-sugar epimerase